MRLGQRLRGPGRDARGDVGFGHVGRRSAGNRGGCSRRRRGGRLRRGVDRRWQRRDGRRRRARCRRGRHQIGLRLHLGQRPLQARLQRQRHRRLSAGHGCGERAGQGDVDADRVVRRDDGARLVAAAFDARAVELQLVLAAVVGKAARHVLQRVGRRPGPAQLAGAQRLHADVEWQRQRRGRPRGGFGLGALVVDQDAAGRQMINLQRARQQRGRRPQHLGVVHFHAQPAFVPHQPPHLAAAAHRAGDFVGHQRSLGAGPAQRGGERAFAARPDPHAAERGQQQRQQPRQRPQQHAPPAAALARRRGGALSIKIASSA